MRYPLELNQIDTDYVVFSHTEYTPNKFQRSGAAPPSGAGGSIVLYMPNSTPSIGARQGWGEQDFSGPIGELKRDLGGFLAESAADADVSSAENAKQSARAAVDNFKTRFESSKGKVGGAVQQGIVMGAAGIAGTSPNQLMALTRGQIYNPNVELLYEGPKIRSFSFNYSFIPKSAAEAAAVNSIIKEFRMWSAPAENGGMFDIPHVWQVTYMNGAAPNTKLNYFKRAALTNVVVQANAGLSMHSSHADGQPIVYNMALSFTEVDLVLRGDHQAGGEIGF